MKNTSKKSLSIVLACVLSVACFSTAAKADGPQEMFTTSPQLAKIAKNLGDKKLRCVEAAPANGQADPNYPLFVTFETIVAHTTRIKVANVNGEDGLSGCCSKVRYSGDTLKFKDGDDDNFVSMTVQISASDVNFANPITGEFDFIDDDGSVSSARKLNCSVVPGYQRN